jgi:hypothetical protein
VHKISKEIQNKSNDRLAEIIFKSHQATESPGTNTNNNQHKSNIIDFRTDLDQLDTTTYTHISKAYVQKNSFLSGHKHHMINRTHGAVDRSLLVLSKFPIQKSNFFKSLKAITHREKLF